MGLNQSCIVQTYEQPEIPWSINAWIFRRLAVRFWAVGCSIRRLQVVALSVGAGAWPSCPRFSVLLHQQGEEGLVGSGDGAGVELESVAKQNGLLEEIKAFSLSGSGRFFRRGASASGRLVPVSRRLSAREYEYSLKAATCV
jgi:hypothetical protein